MKILDRIDIMGLFGKIKNMFTGKKDEVVNYDKGLEKSRREFVSQLSNLSRRYKNIDDNYFEELEDILIWLILVLIQL